MNETETFRAALREGYSLEYVARQHGLSVDTVKRAASYMIGGRLLLIGTEVHISEMRGRWEFVGGVGTSKDGKQYAEFRNTRTGHARTFHTTRITTVHRNRR